MSSNAPVPRPSSNDGVPHERGPELRAHLPNDHVLATLMDEHKHFLTKLARLELLIQAEILDPCVASERQTLAEIRALGDELVAAEPHHQREEEVLFPAVVAAGVAGPTHVMEAEHIDLRALKHAIQTKSANMLDTHATVSWDELRTDVSSVILLLRNHIHKEDEVLYPLAAELIQDPGAWSEMKARCDAIGYCCDTHA